MTRVVAVLWSGVLGGAETFTADLCRVTRDQGGDISVLFLGDPGPLAPRLEAAGVPYTTLGLARGRHVLRRPRGLARAVGELGPDGALLPRAGFLAAALRAGGYRGRVVAVAHDAALEAGMLGPTGHVARRADRASGFWATDVEVAVSDFALSRVRRTLHARRLVRIYNAVDLDGYAFAPRPGGAPLTIGWAGRLIEGKGVDVLVQAFAQIGRRLRARLRIAGDGPARTRLEELARTCGLNGSVEFAGWADDMAAFWQGCDIATMPSNELVESFGMSTVEAMACGRPVVVSANGALPELVEDGVTGFVVPRGDARALAGALAALGSDDERRAAAGTAARDRCRERFDIRECAASYLQLFRNGVAS